MAAPCDKAKDSPANMALRDYYSGWDFERLGTGSVTFTDSGGAWTMTFTEGAYAHIDFTGAMGGTDYDDFATAIAAKITAAARPVTYAVSYSASTMRYSLDVTSGSGSLAVSFSGAAGDIMKHILGFSGNVAATTSAIVSDVRPYYVIRAISLGPSNYSDEYESDDGINEDEADDGSSVSISRTSLPVYLDWEQHLEEINAPAAGTSAGAGVFERTATAGAPWTWQHMIRHIRATEPFALYNEATGDGVVCTMRAEAANAKPVIVTADYSTLWNLVFKTRLLGSL